MSESSTITVNCLPTWITRRPIPLLVFLCLVAWLPGTLALPPLDRDESRFAQASKQMIESGDYVDIRFITVPRYNKPVGIYWAQAATTRLFGHPPYNQIWTYRLPSFFGGILAALLTYWCARAFASRETALVGATLLALTALLSAEAQIATTDALLLAAILAAESFLLRLYLHARGRIGGPPSLGLALAVWAAMGVGILLKGPVILAVLGLTALALCVSDRDWRWLRGVRAGPGILVMLAVVLPWAIAIAFASHGAFYQRSLGHDFAAKILGGQETHGAPPGYYLALASFTLWPATLFALPAIGRALAQRAEPPIRFLLAWAVPNWLLFELVPTKLPHYVLPVYPALALMAALWITAIPSVRPRLVERVLRILSTLLFLAVSVAAAVTLMIAPARFGSGADKVSILGAVIVLALSLGAAVLLLRGNKLFAMVCAAAAALVLYPLICAGVAPRLEQLWISRAIAAHLQQDRVPADSATVLAGYVEPSAVFLMGTNTHLESGRSAGAALARQGGIAIVEDRERDRFLKALHLAGGRERPLDQLSGFDYSRGRREHITFYRITPRAAGGSK